MGRATFLYVCLYVTDSFVLCINPYVLEYVFKLVVLVGVNELIVVAGIG